MIGKYLTGDEEYSMDNNRRILIVGAGRFAADVADLIDDIPGSSVVGFVVDRPPFEPGKMLLGRPIHWIDDLDDFDKSCQAVCAIGSWKRMDIISKVAQKGFQFTTVIHPSARISRTAEVEAGTIISGGVQVAAQVQIGRHVIINRGALIGHNDRIFDYAYIAPGANLAGNITIGARTWIGLGANILEDLIIGEQCIIGAGSLLTRDVPDRVKAVGSPAMIIEKEIQGF
jgi:sugar O-acyltransferase (sialic acid O-acetyltransferase NeuD family)